MRFLVHCCLRTGFAQRVERALKRIEDKRDELSRLVNSARKEEITQELQIIMLSVQLECRKIDLQMAIIVVPDQDSPDSPFA